MESAGFAVGSIFTRLGIILCIGPSAMFSRLSLALFSTSRPQLDIEQADGNSQAARALVLRKDAGFI